jgi:hypothetical protein
LRPNLTLASISFLVFLRDRYKSVMSTPRQTNGDHGFLISLHKVRYYLKAEQLFAMRPRRGLVLTYKHKACITHGISTNTFEIYQSLRSIGNRKRVYLILHWGFVKRNVNLPPPFRNIDEVESNVQQAWQQSADISDYYSKIHLSRGQHCLPVIRARGGHTRY